MIRRFAVSFLLCVFFFCGYAGNSPVLEQCVKALENIAEVRYQHTRIIDYPSRNVHSRINGKAVYDFTARNNTISSRCYFETDNYILVYNGNEMLDCNKKNMSMEVKLSPERKMFENYSFLNHSLYSLRQSLPRINSDKSIVKTERDTLIDNALHALVEFWLDKEIIATLGDKWPVSENIRFRYTIIIRRSDYLPVKLLLHTNINDDLLAVSYDHIEIANRAGQALFNYTTYAERFKLVIGSGAQKPELVPLSVNEKAPDFSLPVLGQERNMNLTGLKGRLTLLDFWFKNCGPCIASIPELNALQKKFGGQVRIVGINTADTPAEIAAFRKRIPIDYMILLNGAGVAKKYGVDKFPTCFLIDGRGQIIYSGGFDKAAIEKIISQNVL